MERYVDNLKFESKDMIPCGVGAILYLSRYAKNKEKGDERLTRAETALLVGFNIYHIATFAAIPYLALKSDLVTKVLSQF